MEAALPRATPVAAVAAVERWPDDLGKEPRGGAVARRGAGDSDGGGGEGGAEDAEGGAEDEEEEEESIPFGCACQRAHISFQIATAPATCRRRRTSAHGGLRGRDSGGRGGHSGVLLALETSATQCTGCLQHGEPYANFAHSHSLAHSLVCESYLFPDTDTDDDDDDDNDVPALEAPYDAAVAPPAAPGNRYGLVDGQIAEDAWIKYKGPGVTDGEGVERFWPQDMCAAVSEGTDTSNLWAAMGPLAPSTRETIRAEREVEEANLRKEEEVRAQRMHAFLIRARRSSQSQAESASPAEVYALYCPACHN
ncbi:hypothetical protein DFH06DRAFT_1137213 [Mycena polygramma]|nr:hypothetical protein DFH06DRAFT_1137213 [Mycena polygramma]